MKLLSTAILTLSLCSFGAAQQHFAELSPLTGAPFGFGLTVSDLDGDGDLDLGTGPWGGALRVFLNDGNGTMTEVLGAGPVGGLFTNDLKAADVDGDGDLDILIVNLQRPMQLYANNGDGTFSDRSQAALGAITGYEAADFGDFDGDGDADLMVAGDPSENAFIFVNDGSGVFRNQLITLPNIAGRVERIRSADLDGDGDLDAVLATSAGATLLINDGRGVMADRSSQFPAGTAVVADVQLGDVDGDGDLDAVLGRSSLASDLVILLNDGGAVFETRAGASAPPPTSIMSLALGDADEDGDLDLAVGTWSDAPVEFYLNKGTGRFEPAPGRLPRPGDRKVDFDATQNMVFADLDGDGDAELILGNQWTGNSRNPARILTNLHRQSHAVAPPRIGEVYTIDLFSQPGYATAVTLALPLVGTAAAQTPFGALGVLRIAPERVAALGLVFVPLSGRATQSLSIPNNPQLVGVALLSQALFVSTSGAARFGNLVSDRIGQ